MAEEKMLIHTVRKICVTAWKNEREEAEEEEDKGQVWIYKSCSS